MGSSWENRGRKSARHVALYGMLIALAFIFSYIEALFPMPVPVPGIKLGLANLVNVTGLYTVGVAGTIAVGLVRIVLVGFTFGNTFSMIYGLAGGALSLTVMTLMKKSGWFGTIGVSVAGGIFHNIGQLLIAAFVTRTMGVFSYFPVLAVAGVITGAVIGILGGLITERISGFVKHGSDR